MVDDSEWLTQRQIAALTGKELREVREAVRNLRRAGVIQTMASPKDERVMLVHRDALTLVKAALRVQG
jgi:hypothetical protein